MFRVIVITVACVLAAAVPSARQGLPLEPPKDAGVGITPAYEGWYANPDGTFTLLIGFFNRNLKQTMDIPIGPNNRIEPGGPDMGQPTYFGVRRNWGVFTIVVPKDFGNKRYTWTVVANGRSSSIPVGLIKDYQLEPFEDVAMKNKPPTIKLAENGKELTGPPRGIAATYTATAGTPLALTAWVADDARVDPDDALEAGRGAGAGAGAGAAAGRGGAGAAVGAAAGAGAGRGGRGSVAPVRLSWHKFRGPGDVTFAEASPKIDAAAGGKATTTATFSLPGEYIIRAQVNDRTGDGGGGFQCCWTNAHVKVTVTGTPTTK